MKHILFDMGNVLIRFDSQLFLSRLGIHGEDAAYLTRYVFRSLEWIQMDRGTLTEEETVKILQSRLPERFTDIIPKLVCQWELFPIPGMAELVQELKENGYHLYLLSNAGFRQHEYWPNIPGSSHFDGTFISCDHGILKPQPEFYQKALSIFDLQPEECVFIDDAPANVEGAHFCGIPGIIFHADVQELRAALVQLGVTVKQ